MRPLNGEGSLTISVLDGKLKATDEHDHEIDFDQEIARKVMAEFYLVSGQFAALPCTGSSRPVERPSVDIIRIAPEGATPIDLWVDRESGRLELAAIVSRTRRDILQPEVYSRLPSGRLIYTEWRRDSGVKIVVENVTEASSATSRDFSP